MEEKLNNIDNDKFVDVSVVTTLISTEPEIEEEQQGTELIKTPFNPSAIRIRRDPFTLGELIDKMQYNEIRFDTPFQRKADLWDEDKQSRLIESILLRLPLPAFYFDETDENRQVWNVIDGLQRCSAFKHFIIENSLPLTGLEFLEDYKDYTYKNLPRELQRRIQQTPITIYVVEKGTPEEVKFNIFKRINTGGLVLTPQEIRHAMNQGKSAEFVALLAQEQSFKEATENKIPTDRMEDQDFVTRFVSFYLLGENQYQPDLDSFMSRGMAEIRFITDEELNKMMIGFRNAMLTAIAIFGNDAFRKRSNIEDRRKPINKTLFEVFSVCFAQLCDEDRRILISKKIDFREEFMNLNDDVKFVYAITSGTGNKDSVKIRYAMIREIIDKVLKK